MEQQFTDFRQELPDIHEEGKRLRLEEEFEPLAKGEVIGLRRLFARRFHEAMPDFWDDVQRSMEHLGLDRAEQVNMRQLHDLYYELRSRGWSREEIMNAGHV